MMVKMFGLIKKNQLTNTKILSRYATVNFKQLLFNKYLKFVSLNHVKLLKLIFFDTDNFV